MPPRSPEKKQGADEQNRKSAKQQQDTLEEKRVDPDADPAAAFDKVLKRSQEEQQKKHPDKPDQDVPHTNRTSRRRTARSGQRWQR